MKSFKKIILLTLLYLLPACSVIGAFSNEKEFDNKEYTLFVDIYISSEKYKHECADLEKTKTNVKNIHEKIDYTYTYTLYKFNNQNYHEMAFRLRNITERMYNRYFLSTETPSEAYCRSKFIIIKQGAAKTLEALREVN